MKRVLLTMMLALMALPVLAQGPALPPGKWWDRAEVIERLELTSDQRSRLDQIFRSSANDLIDLKGEVEKRSVALRGEMDQMRLNRQSIQSAAARLNEARARLFERELMMFVDMRGVLTDDQWTRFRDTLSRRAQQRDERRPAPRRPRN